MKVRNTIITANQGPYLSNKSEQIILAVDKLLNLIFGEGFPYFLAGLQRGTTKAFS